MKDEPPAESLAKALGIAKAHAYEPDGFPARLARMNLRALRERKFSWFGVGEVQLKHDIDAFLRDGGT